MTCRDGTEATGGGASELSARSPMGLKWPDHTTRTQIHGEGSNTRKKSCEDVDSQPVLLIQLSNTCTLPFGAQVLLRQTTHLAVFFFSASPALLVSCHLFSFQISAPLKGVPVSLNAAAGENGLQVRLWISLVSLNSA